MKKRDNLFIERYIFVSKFFITFFIMLSLFIFPFFLFAPIEVEGAKKIDLFTINLVYYIINVFLIVAMKVITFVYRISINLFGYKVKKMD